MGGRTVGYSDDASVVSSSSGRSSGGGTRSSSTPSVPRHILLRKRVLAMAKYAREQARGGNASLSPADRLRLYGGNTIPVAVPLLPGESEAQYEQGFNRYLAEKGYSLTSLWNDPNKERSMRTSFANSKLKSWLLGEREATSTVATRKRGRTSSFSDEDGASENDENQLDVANSVGDSNKRARRDMTPVSASSALLRTRVLSVSEYREEVLRGEKLTEGERRQIYGTKVEPIPVPLFPGETVDEYESRLQAHIATLSVDLSRVKSEPNTERSIRMTFARKRLTSGCPPPLPSKTVPVVLEAALPTPRETVKPSILSRVSDPTSKGDAAPTESAQTAVVQPSHEPIDPKFLFPSSCTLQPPPPGSVDSAIPKAYLACGCRKCLLRCTSRLVRQITVLQQDVEAAKAASVNNNNGSGRKGPVMDLTREGDTTGSATASSIPSSPAATGRGVDVAKMLQIMSLIKNRRQAASSSLSSRVASSSGGGDDPIEQQLRIAYDEINERVIANERVLESEARALAEQTAAFSDHRHHDHSQLQSASRTQDENQELGVYIEEEKDHRDAALAVLVVYTWRHTPQELQQRLEQASASSVAHVTRACHLKCATLASELRALEAEAGELKQQLDAVLSGDVAATGSATASSFGGEHEQDEELRRLMELQRVGEQLTRVETAMQQIHRARHRELTTLVHFDAHVRELAAALLREAI